MMMITVQDMENKNNNQTGKTEKFWLAKNNFKRRDYFTKTRDFLISSCLIQTWHIVEASLICQIPNL